MRLRSSPEMSLEKSLKSQDIEYLPFCVSFSSDFFCTPVVVCEIMAMYTDNVCICVFYTKNSCTYQASIFPGFSKQHVYTKTIYPRFFNALWVVGERSNIFSLFTGLILRPDNSPIVLLVLVNFFVPCMKKRDGGGRKKSRSIYEIMIWLSNWRQCKFTDIQEQPRDRDRCSHGMFIVLVTYKTHAMTCWCQCCLDQGKWRKNPTDSTVTKPKYARIHFFCTFQELMNRGKYAYMGVWVKRALRESSCVRFGATDWNLALFLLYRRTAFCEAHLLRKLKNWRLQIPKSYKVFMEPPYPIVTPY